AFGGEDRRSGSRLTCCAPAGAIGRGLLALGAIAPFSSSAWRSAAISSRNCRMSSASGDGRLRLLRVAANTGSQAESPSLAGEGSGVGERSRQASRPCHPHPTLPLKGRVLSAVILLPVARARVAIRRRQGSRGAGLLARLALGDF